MVPKGQHHAALAMQLTRVQSSHVWEVGYDPETQVLAVRYHASVKHPAGRVVEYHGVDEKTAASVIEAPSVGSALHNFVRGVFEERG
jgi:hypothetical protein